MAAAKRGLRIRGLRSLHVGPIDLAVGAGECVALSGASGAGKTLLLRAIADLDPHEGDVALDGVSCAETPAPWWRSRVGLLPAESAWWDDRVGPHFRKRVDLAPFGFEPDVFDYEVHRMSTGERQRLALARLLSIAPGALLLDEPTASLDSRNATRIEELLRVYREVNEAPTIWVSHDPDQVERVASRCHEMVGGRLRAAP